MSGWKWTRCSVVLSRCAKHNPASLSVSTAGTTFLPQQGRRGGLLQLQTLKLDLLQDAAASAGSCPTLLITIGSKEEPPLRIITIALIFRRIHITHKKFRDFALKMCEFKWWPGLVRGK